MPIETWDEVRTAYQVARLGTVSGAAEVLGVHHATVIRHIDALESRLSVKLFQRHARGYSATEAGQDLLQVAGATAEQFEQLAGRLHGHSAKVTGELVVTSLEVLSPLLTPVLGAYQAEHPDLKIRFLTDTRLFRLEYGEAHVAIRAGKASDEPDNVQQRLFTQRNSLFATEEYVARHGTMGPERSLEGHRFIGSAEDNPRASFQAWIAQTVPEEQIVFRASSFTARFDAVLSGIGVGFLPDWMAARQQGLVRMAPASDQWDTPVWLVTHVDLHRTAKVQSFTAALKEAAKQWDCV